MVVTAQASLGASLVVADDTSAPLAVFIVGPSAGGTGQNLHDAGVMARQAEDAGMRVRKVFHPNATWANVLDAIQGASLVVYMGHGNGWPGPRGPFQEDTKDGFGLNPHEGASAYATEYYGANKMRKRIHLAKDAVVLLEHLCYASGNGEEYMGPEFDKGVATKRVDNFATGFLDIGARAVFAFGKDQRIDLPRALMRGDRTMDKIFQSPNSNGQYDGFVGTDDYYRDSRRTDWARIHLDPHPREGHYRAVTGDLAMTTADFRAGAGDVGGGGTPGGDATGPVLKIQGSGADLATAGSALRFSPNGDGAHDTLRIARTLNERATIRVEVRDRKDKVVRAFSRSGRRGRGTITWDGRDDAGRVVNDGTYHISFTPRDKAGNKGDTRVISALVLTMVRSVVQSRQAILSADEDQLAQSSRIAFTLTRRARVTWVIRDAAGHTVKTHVGGRSLAPGRQAWAWGGRDQRGRFVRPGTYDALITVRTSAGKVELTRAIMVGAFRIESSDTSPDRGQRVSIRVFSTEPLKSAPRLRIEPARSARPRAQHEAGRIRVRGHPDAGVRREAWLAPHPGDGHGHRGPAPGVDPDAPPALTGRSARRRRWRGASCPILGAPCRTTGIRIRSRSR